jgi:serine/threonine protein kinase
MDDCPTDEELIAFARGRLSETELPAFHAHLDGCGTCQQVLAEAAHAFATAITTPMSEDGDWNTTFQRGALVAGRYVISRFIARGAMGEVYEAYDRELAERVALKTVASTACDNARAVRRLKAEVQLARRVSHPNVCRIYDFGTHVMPETGVQLHFLTMEFVEGETLGQRIRLGGALPIPEALETARELLLALRAAHAAAVLHRDFKSDNVMLKLAPSEQTTPVVLDFGLARAVDHHTTSSGASASASASRPTFVGTFGYMAPELLEGMPHSTASDVYAFGVVWFEMLTGELPFEGAATPARALKCLQTPAPPPSSINREITSDLDVLVLRCLERSPRDRFRTATEVFEALATLGPPGSISSSFRPVSTSAVQKPSATSVSPHLLKRVVTGSAVVAALSYAALAWLGWPRPTPTGDEIPPRPSAIAIPTDVAPPPNTATPGGRAIATMATSMAPPPAPATVPLDSNAPARRPLRDRARPPTAPGSHAAEQTRDSGLTAASTSSATSATEETTATPRPAGSTPPAGAPRLPPSAPKPNWENPFGPTDGPASSTTGARTPT